MMMKGNCFFILLFMLASVAGYGKNQNPFFFSHLGVEDGLSQVSVLSIFQDSDGYIWFGTRNGANRYDGYSFNVYRNEANDPESISDDNINKINEDRNKNVWIGTSNGLNCMDYKTQKIVRLYPQTVGAQTADNEISNFLRHSDGELYAFANRSVFRCNPDKSIEKMPWLKEVDAYVLSVIQDRDGDIYVGTRNKGLYIFSADWVLKKHCLPDSTTNPQTLPADMITALFDGPANTIFIGTNEKGVCLYDKEARTFTRLDTKNSGLNNNSIRAFNAFGKDSVLVGTFRGLNILNVGDWSVSSVKTNMQTKGALSHYSVHSMLIDRNQTLWVGTYSAGVNYHSPFYQPTLFIKPDAFTGIVGKGQEDDDGNMWFATEGGGLLFYNPRNDEQRLYPVKALEEGNYDINIIKSILVQGDSILCATHFGSVYLFSIRSKQYKKIHDYTYNDIYTLFIDSRQRLWIPTNTSAYSVMVDKGETVNRFTVNGLKRPFKSVCLIKELEPDRFLFGTITDSVFVYDMNKEEVTDITDRLKQGEQSKRLGNIAGALQDADQQLWIATTKAGLFRLDRELNVMQNYRKENRLPESYINSISIDKRGTVWVTTDKELCKLNRTGDTFEPVNFSDSPTQGYTLFANNAVSSDGTLYFSGNKGILAVNPQKMITNPYAPEVRLTSVLINNRDTPDDSTRQQELSPRQYDNDITLAFHQRDIAIRYSALNFIYPETNSYACMMEGIDHNWRSMGNHREVYYSNLSPGEYVFRVKASNNDGLWSLQDAVLHITVKPPLYKTWWAYVIYSCALSLGTILFVRRQHRKQEQKREEKYKQLEQKRMNELHSERMRMFTNFSHELRTPLTLIINQLNDILQRGTFSPEVKNALRSTRKNTDRMLLLVNNLMDIQKYEAGKTILQKATIDFSAFVQKIYSSFESLATNRKIRFTLDNQLPGSSLVFYDEAEIEKAFFNLLSNAFKFTPAGGAITIRIRRLAGTDCEGLPLLSKNESFRLVENSYLFIEVIDTGIGFDPEKADKLFEPFHQDETDVHKQLSGTGIGLSLTRSIVLQHHGCIGVESAVGKGANFMILLPDTEEQKEQAEKLILSPTSEISKKVALLVEETEAYNRKIVLLADDNQEVLDYLEQQLRHDYVIMKATNGKDAFDQLKQTEPHIVISDVMMPEMSGLELCRRIRESQEFSHIPVILLTAKSMPSQVEEGLEAGADDYIAKPFYVSLLKARIKNILALREKMKNASGESLILSQLGISGSEDDDNFLNRYIEIVKDNITNQEFDVSTIYQALGMSRANFYRKVKTATGLSPIELIKNIRLQAGSKLLAESSMNVSEVAQQVGFSSRSYFARSFKTVYGMSPTAYQEKNKRP